MSNVIGIDLGTTHSLCAVFRDSSPILIPNSHGGFLTPSVVGILESGEIVVGSAAKELRVTHPERTASCFKRYMGSDRKIQVGPKTFLPYELSSLVLKSLVADAENFLGEEVTEAVITVPAYFHDHQRQATKIAGELAGLRVRRIINEPTAAALVYGFHARDQERQLCVIDLGGGTFDVTIMEVFEGTLEIRSTAGESMLGGEDFTDRIVSAILQHEKLQLEVAELKQPLRVARLRVECEQAKRKLASEEVVRIRLPDLDGTIAETPKEFRVDRNTFARLSEGLMKRISTPIDRALRDANLTPREIDDVLLVGGATRMPILQDYMKSYFGKPPSMDHNPDEVVALGAAIQAALMENDSAVNDLVMTDVCPFTLGVEIAKEFGGQTAAGYFHPILHRNSTIPISREEVFVTVAPNQKQVEVRVYQGDARKVADNIALGSLSVKDIAPGPAGQPIHIRFTYDLNGLLEVEAYSAGGKKHRTVLTNHVHGLNEDQIRDAIDRLQALKIFPRENLEYQKLARFCERMLGEINREERKQLDRALDYFEGAMASCDKAECERAEQVLRTVLAELGIEYFENDDE
jgi:molecular chaperone HscC